MSHSLRTIVFTSIVTAFFTAVLMLAVIRLNNIQTVANLAMTPDVVSEEPATDTSEKNTISDDTVTKEEGTLDTSGMLLADVPANVQAMVRSGRAFSPKKTRYLTYAADINADTNYPFTAEDIAGRDPFAQVDENSYFGFNGDTAFSIYKGQINLYPIIGVLQDDGSWKEHLLTGAFVNQHTFNSMVEILSWYDETHIYEFQGLPGSGSSIEKETIVDVDTGERISLLEHTTLRDMSEEIYPLIGFESSKSVSGIANGDVFRIGNYVFFQACIEDMACSNVYAYEVSPDHVVDSYEFDMAAYGEPLATYQLSTPMSIDVLSPYNRADMPARIHMMMANVPVTFDTETNTFIQ